MRAGYLILKADTGRDGVVLLSKSLDEPNTEEASSSNIFWIGEFKDIDTAQMHAHGYYCRQLVDVDEGSYKVSQGRAVAAIECGKLIHETVYRGAIFDNEGKSDLAKWEAYYKRRKRRFAWFILALKVLAISYLAFIFIMTF